MERNKIEGLLLKLNEDWKNEDLHREFWNEMKTAEEDRCQYLLTYIKLGKALDSAFIPYPIIPKDI